MQDVFISYSHKDNDSPRYGELGWVDCFFEALKDRLESICGREVTVWRDASNANLTGGMILTPKIKQELSRTRVLVAIVSPSYAASQWCKDELQYFRESAGNLAAVGGTMTRVLKVAKLPTPQGRLSTGIHEIDDAVGHTFYRTKANGDPILPPEELDAPHGTFDEPDFRRAVNKLAYDIEVILTWFDQQEHSKTLISVPQPGLKPRAVIYLADATSEMDEDRKRIRQEFEGAGYTVIPAEQRFPGPDYSLAVQSDLARARLSIHLIGATYGMVPEKHMESIVELQYALAAAEALKRPEFKRMVWIQPGTKAADERQARFMASMQDAIVTPLEEFKTLIYTELRRKPAPVNAPGYRTVYLIFDKPDKDAKKAIDDFLFSRGFDVLRPPANSTSLHKSRLKDSDAVLVYYGNSPSDWVEETVDGFKKVLRGKSKAPRAVYLADPDQPPEKRDFRRAAVRVIDGFGGFTPSQLDGFLADIDDADSA